MKRIVSVNGDSAELEFQQKGCEWSFRYSEDEISTDGTVSIVEVESGVYSLLWGTRSIAASVSGGRSGFTVTIAGRSFEVTTHDPRDASANADGTHHAGPAELVALMPGRVVRVLAAQGDDVEQGQGVIVIEAMKMQNEMKAPKAGKIVSIRVGEGEAIAAGDVLAVIE